MTGRAPADLQAGHEVAKKTCFVCHKLYGEGAEIGPDLTGSGRHDVNYLLENIVDPSAIVGQDSAVHDHDPELAEKAAQALAVGIVDGALACREDGGAQRPGNGQMAAADGGGEADLLRAQTQARGLSPARLRRLPPGSAGHPRRR